MAHKYCWASYGGLSRDTNQDAHKSAQTQDVKQHGTNEIHYSIVYLLLVSLLHHHRNA